MATSYKTPLASISVPQLLENIGSTVIYNEISRVHRRKGAQAPCLLTDIAKDTQLKSSDITAQMKRLKDRNLVEVIKGKPKKSLYQIKSNLLKAWYKDSSIEKLSVASHF